MIDSRVREVTVAIHLRIWDCLNRSEKLATQSLSVTAEIGYDRIYVGAARREKALFALRLLHNIMIPGTYNPDILPDIQHAFANGALVQGNAQSLLDAAIADQDLVAQLVYCRELLELNQKKLPEEDEAQDPRLTHFYEWLNRHPQHRQALSAFYHELDKTITLELKQTLIQAFDHLFHQYNSEPLSRFFSMPGTSNIQLCMEKYIVPVIQATREYYQPEPRKLRAQVQQRVRIDLTQKPLFGFLSPNKADRARRERSDDPPSTITGKKQRSIKNEVLEENLPPQPQ